MQSRGAWNAILALLLSAAIGPTTLAAPKQQPEPDLDNYSSLGYVLENLPTDLSAKFSDDITLKRMEVPYRYYDYFTISGGLQSGYRVQKRDILPRLAMKVDLPYAGSETQRKEDASQLAEIGALESRLSSCAEEEKAGTAAFCKTAVLPFCASRYTHKPSAQCQNRDLQNVAQNLIEKRKMLENMKKRPAVTSCYLSMPGNAEEILLAARGKRVAADVSIKDDPESRYHRDYHLYLKLPASDGAHVAEVSCDGNVSLRMLQDGFAQQGLSFNWKSRARERIPRVENLGLENAPDSETKSSSAN